MSDSSRSLSTFALIICCTLGIFSLDLQLVCFINPFLQSFWFHLDCLCRSCLKWVPRWASVCFSFFFLFLFLVMCARLSWPNSCIISCRHRLYSVNCGQLDVQWATLSSYSVRAFMHTGPSWWNAVPLHLRNCDLTLITVIHDFKSYLLFFSADLTLSTFQVCS